MRLAWAFAIMGLLVAGCGDGSGQEGSPNQGPKEIPDGFVQTGCQVASDCDDGNPCTTDNCAPATHQCAHAQKVCPADSCNTGSCNMVSGSCGLTPTNESMMCLTSQGDPGSCTNGYCRASPQCEIGGSSALGCGAPIISDDTSDSSYTNVLDTYACATGLTGSEVGYALQVATDRNVTLSLSKTTVDLDLIVLEGTACVATAKCAAFATTAGTGNETLTFLAKANQGYIIVIDGKNGAVGSFQLNIACDQLCNTTTVLTCNQTIMGDTATVGTPAKLNLTDCSPTPTPGPENSWKLPNFDGEVKLKLSQLTQDLDLFVLLDDHDDCDGTCNTPSTVQSGTTSEEASFTSYSDEDYHVVVDSKSTGGPYQLEVNCIPSCSANTVYADCSDPVVTMRSDDPDVSSRNFDSWACAPNETGNEVVHEFLPFADGPYTFELTGLTEDLDLIVLASDTFSCDPTVPCVAQSLKLGTASESVTFMADSNKLYYVIVDGKAGAASNYTLTVKSALCGAQDCSNSANQLSCLYREEVRSSANPAHSMNTVSDWSCDPGTGGPEVVYTFDPTVAGSYTVTLDGITAGQDLDLVVLEDHSGTCDPAAMCYAHSVTTGNANESVTFMADPANTYYIAVDGQGTSSSTYHIKLDSTSCGAPACKNGNNSLSCTTPSVNGANDASGATSTVSTWTCTGLPTNETGPEFAHKFTPTVSGTYTVELIGLHADLDLLVLEADATGKCAAGGTCLGASYATGNTAEKVTFTADSTKTYYFVVDGKAGAVSQYTLAVTDGCP